MSAAKRKSDPASRRTVAANPEDAAVNKAAEQIAKRVRSGRSAYVWCSEGPLVDEAMRRAGEWIDGGRVIELRQPLSSPYVGSFCSQLGNELFGKEYLKCRDILKKLQSEKKSRIVISITQRMLAVQNPTENENAFANWLGYFIGELQERKAVVILGARMPHEEFEELHRGSPQLPFKADQEIAIDNKDDGHQTSSVGKNTSSTKKKRMTGRSKHKGKTLGERGRVEISEDGRSITIGRHHFRVGSEDQWKILDLLFEGAEKSYRNKVPFERFGFVPLSYKELISAFKPRKEKGKQDPRRLIDSNLIEGNDIGANLGKGAKTTEMRFTPKLFPERFPERFPK